jgi:hypothetical protein
MSQSRSTSVLQAKKEEAWEAAKRAGEGGDKRSDRGYLDATKAVGGCPSLKGECLAVPWTFAAEVAGSLLQMSSEVVLGELGTRKAVHLMCVQPYGSSF